MAYTPELSLEHSRTLRRVAWALELPMTKAMGAVFNYVAENVDKKKVCAACKDKTRCQTCAFKGGRFYD